MSELRECPECRLCGEPVERQSSGWPNACCACESNVPLKERLRRARQEAPLYSVTRPAPNGLQGHDEPCYYCGKPCDALAGAPSQWPIPLTHPDDPGVVKWHHIGCVSERLNTRPAPDKSAEEWAGHLFDRLPSLVYRRDYDVIRDAFATALTAAQDKGLERAEEALKKQAAHDRETAALFRGERDCEESCRAWMRRALMFDEGAGIVRALRSGGEER